MFKTAELPWLITFFQMFYNDKPVDWLLDHLLYTKVCNYEKNNVSSKKITRADLIIKMQSILRCKPLI